jgi:hypothetical protein
LNTTLMPHSINHGDACLAYFNKIWGIPCRAAAHDIAGRPDASTSGTALTSATGVSHGGG